MNIRLLKVFVIVADTQNVTRAAETLHTTQPAVSQALAQLEKAVGLTLFDRLGKRLHLTGAGKLFLEKARLVVQQYEQLADSASSLAGQATLRIGSCITIANQWLPALMRWYEAEADAAPLSVEVASARLVLERLEANAIDIALYEGPAPGGPFESHVFSSYRLTPVCAAGHGFAGREIGLDALLEQPLLLRERGSAIRDVFDSFLRLEQKQAHAKIVSVNSQALIQAAKAGLGVSILPDAIVNDEVERGGLAEFAVRGMRLGNDNRVMLHKDKQRDAALELFIAAALRCGKHDKE